MVEVLGFVVPLSPLLFACFGILSLPFVCLCYLFVTRWPFLQFLGIDLGLQKWVKSVSFCECAPAAKLVLQARMRDGQLPKVPIHPDITTMKQLPNKVDIEHVGFPCPDISSAGLQWGLLRRYSHPFRIVLSWHEARPRGPDPSAVP